MPVDRRGFLLGSVAAGASLAALGRRAHGAPPREAKLRISSQEGRIPGKSLGEKLERMAEWGIEGLEVGGGACGDPKRYLDALKGSKVRISAVCWGSAGGALVSEDPARRTQGQEQLKRTLTGAGELGAVGVIFVPAFNGQTKLPHHEIRKVLVDTLPAIGEHAVQCKTLVLLEPLNRGEAYFLRQLADAAAIARDCKSKGIAIMGDFYHMAKEETSDLGAIVSAGDYLHHIHLASRSRVLPGQDDRSFVDGFRGLRMIGYQDFCSFECGCRGKPEEEIPKSVAFLRDQWEQSGKA